MRKCTPAQISKYIKKLFKDIFGDFCFKRLQKGFYFFSEKLHRGKYSVIVTLIFLVLLSLLDKMVCKGFRIT